MKALISWVANIVQSSDGATPSATRVAAMLVTIAFIVLFLWKPDQVGGLGIAAGFASTLFGVRDGGPIDAFLAARGSRPDQGGH